MILNISHQLTRHFTNGPKSGFNRIETGVNDFQAFIIGGIQMQFIIGAQDETRTRTDITPRDFKSLVSTIPPPGRVRKSRVMMLC